MGRPQLSNMPGLGLDGLEHLSLLRGSEARAATIHPAS